MAEKKEYKEFRKLLKKAIGFTRTQAEFAQKADITPQHLNRLINNPLIGQPSKDTLIKIAGNADTPIPLNDLFKACEYTIEEKPKSVDEKTEIESIENTASKIESSFGLLSGKEYKSLNEFIEKVLHNVSTDISYELENKETTENKNGTLGENVITARMTWVTPSHINSLDTLIAYSETKNNNIIVLETSNNYNKFETYYPNNMFSQDDENQTSTLYIEPKFKPKRCPYITTEENDGLTTEQRLLRAIFGEDNKPQRIATVEGIGFYIDKIPEGAFRRFILQHKAYTCENSNDKQILENYLQSITPKEDMFKNNKSSIEHFGEIIANVITQETAFRIECWEDHNHRYPFDNRPSIMFTAEMPWVYTTTEKALSFETLFQILDKYARELRCEVESCYFIMTMDQN